MGNVIETACVSLEHSHQFTDPLYMVKRTSGVEDFGWRISKPCVGAGQAAWLDKHALKDAKLGIWRIFMHNGADDPNEYAHGWRRVDTIYPTDLKGNPEEILVWRANLIRHLESLEATRLVSSTTTIPEVSS